MQIHLLWCITRLWYNGHCKQEDRMWCITMSLLQMKLREREPSRASRPSVSTTLSGQKNWKYTWRRKKRPHLANLWKSRTAKGERDFARQWHKIEPRRTYLYNRTRLFYSLGTAMAASLPFQHNTPTASHLVHNDTPASLILSSPSIKGAVRDCNPIHFFSNSTNCVWL